MILIIISIFVIYFILFIKQFHISIHFFTYNIISKLIKPFKIDLFLNKNSENTLNLELILKDVEIILFLKQKTQKILINYIFNP